MVGPLDKDSWLGASGKDWDIVLSSRVRLARNVAGVPFVGMASDPDRNEVVGMVRRIPMFAGTDADLTWHEMENMEDRDRRMLVERHLISHQFADATFPRGVAISKDQRLSVMVNEEDHLRIQTLAPGLALREAFQRVSEVRDEFESSIEFAFSPRWGFLTACPTNVGCGIRFSVMLHLPAIRITEELGRVRQAAKDLDLAVRGYHGEGSESIGDFFQISNQITLGTSEDDLLEEFLGAVVPRLVEYERHARTVLQEKKRVMLEDFVHRAHGALLSARLLGIDEAIKLLSRLRIGRALEVVGSPDLAVIHRLLLNVQPAHLCALSGTSMEEGEETLAARAEMVRNALS